MYSAVVILHSWLRWAVILVALLALVQAIGGLSGNRPWSRSLQRNMRIFTGLMDLQLVIGLVLYVFLSPFTRAAFQDMAAAMRNAGTRFFAVEHLVGMIIAVIFAHVGSVQVRKASSDGAKYQRAAAFLGIAVLIILASIPWPGLSAGRPLFRF